MKQLRFFLFALFLGLFSSLVIAQQADKKIEDSAGNPKIIKFNLTTKTDVLDSKDLLLQYLPNESKENFKLTKIEEDKIGFSHEKFQQYKNGIKVEHGIYTIHKKDKQVYSLTGDYIEVSESKDKGTQLSEEEALQKAIDFINAEIYMWENEDNEDWAKQVEPNGTFYPSGELVYIKDYLNNDLALKFQPILAYKFNIYAQKPLSRNYVYVNASNGDIAFKDAIIKLVNKSAKNNKHVSSDDKNQSTKSDAFAATRYSNDQIITTTTSGSNFILREYTRGDGIETYNMQNGIYYNQAVDFTDDNNQWTADEHHNSLKDDAALDAHWGTEEIWDYWMIKHGRNSFDGNGAALKSYVHFNLIQYGYSNNDNAFWNGSVMTYGDGTSFDPLTSLDVAAHEIGHAVCSYTANLIYSYESGAINEGFSDIWAACAENYAAPEKSIWLIGEDIGGPIRSMSNPNTFGLPDTYLGTNWHFNSSDNGGVHTNNGPFCFWFYLLSEGGSGTNDNGDGYSVTGISIEKAERIAYRTEVVYLNPDDEYVDLREASILATEDLFGEGSNEVQQVKNAWDAVGVYEPVSSTNYCASQSNDSYYIWLQQVDIGSSFSNTSSSSNYSDFTTQNINLKTGEEYNIYLKQSGYNGSNRYQLHWIIWIDLNGDFDFEDPNEEIFYTTTPSGTENISGSFVIPEGMVGTTRMRIAISYLDYPGTKPLPCSGNIEYGEIEDYTVQISGGTVSSDIEAPTAPSGLYANGKTKSSISLAWNPSTDNIGVAGYKIYKDGDFVQNVEVTNTSIYGLSKETSYSFYVKAYDMSDNISGASNTINITTKGDNEEDTEPPTTPKNLSASDIEQTSLKLNWEISTDNVGIEKYQIMINGFHHSYVTTNSKIITGLTPGTDYNFAVIAFDISGNTSGYSNWVFITTESEIDNKPPSTPQNLNVVEIGETDVLLNWEASTDNLGVKHYNIYKNSVFESTSSGTGIVLSGLTPLTNYSVSIDAEDDAGNTSSRSNTINFTTDGEVNMLQCNFKLTIHTDTWGYETSWEIMDNSSSVIIKNGSGYPNNSMVVENFTLDGEKEYTFTIYDSFGDGIYNDPGYILENNAGLILIQESGYDFSSSRSHIFNSTCAGGVVYEPTFPSYCSSKGNNQTDEWIDYISLGAINNSTGPETGGYGSYINLTPMLLTSHSYNLYLSAGFSDIWENEYWRVWIDFNIDGDFNDTDELIAEGGPFAYDGVISAPFTVPSTITSGYTVMRVSMKWNDYPLPCEIFEYGEVEDYPIKLSENKTATSGTEISLNNVRDINDPIASKRSILYPNPATEFITIDNTGRDNNIYEVLIYNITGALVKTKLLNNNSSKIDVSDLPQGLYTVVINSERKNINSKFIKQ